MGCGASSALDDAQRRIVRLEAAIADMEKKAKAQAQPTSTNSADPDDQQRAQSQPPKAAKPAAAGSADNEHVHPFGGEQGTVEQWKSLRCRPRGLLTVPFSMSRVCVCVSVSLQ